MSLASHGVKKALALEIDGRPVEVPSGATVLEACRAAGVATPTLCYLENLTPVNVCRVCVVELEGSRTLIPACSRRAQDGMKIQTDSPRVRLSRRMVLEFLASSIDVSQAPDLQAMMQRYEAQPSRYGPAAADQTAGARDRAHAGHHPVPDGLLAQTVRQPPKVDNELYVRDYAKCILCYKCVEACGSDAQNTFAIAVGGRGFEARITTEYAVPLPDSACVYCGNCIGVCPTNALSFKTEFDMRRAGSWDESRQVKRDTICPYCGVGCTLTVHAQDGEIVKVSSPIDHDITRGHLCIKGRFGWQFVNKKAETPER